MSNKSILLVGGLVTVLVGIGIGTMVFAWTNPSVLPVAQATATVVPAIPTARPPATLTPIPTPGAVGSVGHLKVSGGQYPYSMIWVEQLGLYAVNRASADRDDKGLSRALDVFEYLNVPDGTPVKVTARTRDAIQVEVMSGKYAGRRGWVDSSLLVP